MITIRVDNRSIPAAAYLAGLRAAKANPDQKFSSSLRGRLYPATGAEIMRQYHDDMQSRINQRGGLKVPNSRVHPATWAKAATPRVILERHDIRSMNRSARRRLEHRMRDADWT